MIKSALDQVKNNQTIYDLFSQVKNAPGKVIDLSLGNPAEKPPQYYREVLLATTKQMIETDHNSFLYQTGFGSGDASDRISLDLQKRFSIPFTQEQVIMTVGATGALDAVISTIVDNKRATKRETTPEVIVLTPHFVEYDTIIEQAGATVIRVSTNDDCSLNSTSIRNALTADCVAILLNSPNNPTGAIYSESSLENLAQLLKEMELTTGTSISIIEDAVYDRVIPSAVTVPSMMLLWSETIRVDSFSKSLRIPGERIGYIAVNPHYEGDLECSTLLEALRLRIRSRVVHPSVIQQKVISQIGLLDDTSCYFYNEYTDALTVTLQELGFTVVPPKGTFYIWAKLPEAIESEALFREAAFSSNPALVYMPGSVFGGSRFERYIRLSTCVSDETVSNALTQLPMIVERCTAGVVTP
ncbi:MAG: aminotransferase class I/II-fold pyridoxal phosphate-dependent enzyme [Fibrobacterales bacterium]